MSSTAIETGEREPKTTIPHSVVCLYRWDAARAEFTPVVERNSKYVRLHDAR